MTATVTKAQRFSRRNPCPICGGGADLPQGRGVRCHGFLSDDGQYAHCSREEYAGSLDQDAAGTYAHRLEGDCRCGKRHDPRPRSLPPVASTKPTSKPKSPKPSTKSRRETGRRDYRIIDRQLIPRAIHRRIEYVDAYGERSKDFIWLQPDGETSGLNGVPVTDLPLYGIHELSAGGGDFSILMHEGEKSQEATDALDAPNWLSVATVTGAQSTPSMRALAPLAGHPVYLWPDADDDGRRHMERIADKLVKLDCEVKIIRWPDAPPKGDAADFIAQGGTLEDIDGLIASAEPYRPQRDLEPADDGEPDPVEQRDRRVTTRLDGVEPESVSWLWHGRIPLGKLSILDGDPGLGKSTVLLDLAARVTTHDRLPDGTASDLDGPASVVLLSAEDGLADTIRPRLDAAGADCSRIVSIHLEDENGPRELAIPHDLDELEATISEEGAKLVIVDPLVAYFGPGVNAHRDQDVRRALAPLARLADRTGAAIIGIRHLTKDTTNPNATYRGGGSIGIIGAARSGLLIAVDPDDDDRRILARVKGNLAPPVSALAYHLESADCGVASVSWDGVTNHTAAQLLAMPVDGEERSAVDDVAEVLKTILKDGPVAAKDIDAQRKAAGLSEITMRRAKARLGVKTEKVGFGADGVWKWRLPDERQNDDQNAGEDHQPQNDDHLSILRSPLDSDAENGQMPMIILGDKGNHQTPKAITSDSQKTASNPKGDHQTPKAIIPQALQPVNTLGDAPTNLPEVRCKHCRILLTEPDDRHRQMCRDCFADFQSKHQRTEAAR